MSDWSARGSALIEALARADVLALGHQAEVVETLRGLVAEVELTELLLEAKVEELARVREQLAAISYPVLEVREDMLCMPIVGYIDAGVVQEITSKVLQSAAAHRARTVVVDLTGANLADVASGLLLLDMFQALRLIGTRGALCGVSPQLAQTLVELPTPVDVPVHATLAAALAAARRPA
jgi:anti-anti-sigma regulatory factor